MRKSTLLAVSLLSLALVFVNTMAWAASSPQSNTSNATLLSKRAHPGIFGVITAIDPTNKIITVKSGRAGVNNNTANQTNSYAVDVSTATITKDGQTASFTDLAIGEVVTIQGTMSDNNVKASAISINTKRGNISAKEIGKQTQTTLIQGNGQPVVGGTVTSISSSTITITNASNVTYTIDASNAQVVKNHNTASISNIEVGDNIIVQGSVNGTSVIALSIIDQGAPKTGVTTNNNGFIVKVFHGLGNFFHKLFGFF
jgi:hypothetical protein